MRSPALDEQLARLRQQAHEYRAQAIALDARLRLFGALLGVTGLRRKLHETSVRLDVAVASLLR